MIFQISSLGFLFEKKVWMNIVYLEKIRNLFDFRIFFEEFLKLTVTIEGFFFVKKKWFMGAFPFIGCFIAFFSLRAFPWYVFHHHRTSEEFEIADQCCIKEFGRTTSILNKIKYYGFNDCEIGYELSSFLAQIQSNLLFSIQLRMTLLLING